MVATLLVSLLPAVPGAVPEKEYLLYTVRRLTVAPVWLQQSMSAGGEHQEVTRSWVCAEDQRQEGLL